MKTLYEPANVLEAHMLHDLLKQEGISSRVDGAYLQGGVGELPAAGFVRLVVDDADYARARSVIERWEATEISEPSTAPGRPTNAFAAGLAGLLAGALAAYAFFHVPARTDGRDYNHDGQLDERWNYSAHGAFLGTRVDRNLDGKVDYIDHADSRGELESAESDDDFDGVFETTYRFRAGSVESSESDTDGDGVIDLRSAFNHGVLASEEHIDPYTARPTRVDHYRLGRVTHSELDSNGDGTLDTRRSYSTSGKVVREEAITDR
jgi:hypothetical protein